MNRLIGALFIIISATSFGTLAILGRYAYADGMDTFTILALRFTFAAALMALLLFARCESFPRGRTLWQLIGMGAIGYVGQSFSYLTATRFASAGLVALLLYLYPVFVAVLSALILKEKFTRLKILALGLATFGAALTANPQGGGWTGILLAIMAAAIYSVYIIVGTGVMKRVSAFQSSTVIFASAGAVYCTLALVNGCGRAKCPVGHVDTCLFTTRFQGNGNRGEFERILWPTLGAHCHHQVVWWRVDRDHALPMQGALAVRSPLLTASTLSGLQDNPVAPPLAQPCFGGNQRPDMIQWRIDQYLALDDEVLRHGTSLSCCAALLSGAVCSATSFRRSSRCAHRVSYSSSHVATSCSGFGSR